MRTSVSSVVTIVGRVITIERAIQKRSKRLIPKWIQGLRATMLEER